MQKRLLLPYSGSVCLSSFIYHLILITGWLYVRYSSKIPHVPCHGCDWVLLAQDKDITTSGGLREHRYDHFYSLERLGFLTSWRSFPFWRRSIQAFIHWSINMYEINRLWTFNSGNYMYQLRWLYHLCIFYTVYLNISFDFQKKEWKCTSTVLISWYL